MRFRTYIHIVWKWFTYLTYRKWYYWYLKHFISEEEQFERLERKFDMSKDFIDKYIKEQLAKES